MGYYNGVKVTPQAYGDYITDDKIRKKIRPLYAMRVYLGASI
jgi:hypothetical protein